MNPDMDDPDNDTSESVSVLSSPYPGVNFKECCKEHDVCYYKCHINNNPYEDRLKCDKELKSCMFKHCDTITSKKLKKKCRKAAHMYYTGVRIGGKPYYVSGQVYACKRCCEKI
jgi:hypothetical protein